MNEETLFAEAIAIESPEERRRFLDSACGENAELRQGVEKLLSLANDAGSFLEHPPADLTDQPDETVQFENGSASTQDDGAETEDFVPGEHGDMTAIYDDSDDIPLGYLQSSSRADAIGRLAHYEILEVVGRGAFGTVLRAFDEKLQRVVAIKVLAPEMASTSPARKRFLREARTSAAIRHENVVGIHAVEDDPIPYLVMEYIPGKTLQLRLDEHGPLDLADVLKLGKQIADGLAAAHGQGLIHRDIKPGNILLEGGMDERVKITDFGLARTADDASMTQSGMIAGTPQYMAPEQAQGHKLDQRADLFSLGSVLYQMLTGRPPFRAPNTVAVLRRVVDDVPRPMQEIIPEIPTWMSDLVRHLHAKHPDERYQTAKEISDLLARCLEDLKAGRMPKIPNPLHAGGESTEITAAVSSEPTGSRRRESRRMSPLVKITTALVILLGVLGITEATGVTKLASTIIRLTTTTGTLVIETDDPRLKVTVDGDNHRIHGSGLGELTLKPGQYKVAALKDGKSVKQELVSITRNGRTVVRLSLEPAATDAAVEVTPPLATAPPGDYALSFDGQDDYVEVPSLKHAVNSPMTVEAICRIVDLKRSTLVDLGSRETAEFVLRTDAQQWRFERSAGSRWISTRGSQGPKPGLFVHIAGVWDGSRLWLFIDGVLQPGSNTTNQSRQRTQLERLLIGGLGQGRGRQTDPPTELFGGAIKALRISDMARYTSRFTAPADFDSDEHTLALYHFDEGAGDVLTDSSGNGHDGKIFGATWVKADGTAIDPSLYGRSDDRPKSPVATSDPKGDYALSFDGQSYVSTPVDLSVENPFTIEAWAAPASWEGSTLFSVICNAQRAGVSLELRNFEMLNWGFSVQDQQGYQKALSSSGPERGRPVHLAGVFDGSHARLFVNGELMQSEPVLDLPLKPSSLPLLIGANPQPDDRLPIYPFNGTIDEVRFSDVARYTNDFTPATRFEPDDHTLALYHFDEGSGDVLKDVSGNGHDGKIVGATWVRVDDATKTIASSSVGWHGWPADAPPPAIAPFDAEQAKAHQAAWAKYLGVPVEYENSLGMKFRLIPPGEFMMGSTPEEIEAALNEAPEDDKAMRERIKSEAPQHKVVLTQPVYFGVTELTQGQYEQLMGNNPSYFAANGEGKDAVADIDTSNHPVETVNGHDAAEFCAKLSVREDLEPFDFQSARTVRELNQSGYRLPTEAEWEFACRAGTTTRFWTGEEYRDVSSADWCVRSPGHVTHAVGELRPNPFGLFDLHGNVAECVLDAWDLVSYGRYTDFAAIDPRSASPASNNQAMVKRGGDFGCALFRSRAAIREFTILKNRWIGLRLVMPVDVVKKRPSAPPAAKSSQPHQWPADAPRPAIAPFDAEQARAHQAAWAKYLGVPVEYTNSIGMKFRLIPPGEFLMGSTPEAIEAELGIIAINDAN